MGAAARKAIRPSDEEALLGQADALGLTAGEQSRLRLGWRLRQTGKRRDRQEADQLLAGVRRSLDASNASAVSLERHREMLLFRRARELRQAKDAAADEAEQVAADAKVEVFNDAGAVRLRSRDGLASLHTAGRITDAQLNAGLKFRRLHELLARDVRSQLNDHVGDGGDPQAIRLRRALKGIQRGQIELAVLTECENGAQALALLRDVAGDGMSLRSRCAGGKQFDVALSRFVSALDVVAAINLDSG